MSEPVVKKLFAEGIEMPAPAGICDACLLDKRNTFFSARVRCLVSFCAHNKTGGILSLDIGQWNLHTPIARDVFFQILDDATFQAMKAAGILDQQAH